MNVNIFQANKEGSKISGNDAEKGIQKSRCKKIIYLSEWIRFSGKEVDERGEKGENHLVIWRKLKTIKTLYYRLGRPVVIRGKKGRLIYPIPTILKLPLFPRSFVRCRIEIEILKGFILICGLLVFIFWRFLCFLEVRIWFYSTWNLLVFGWALDYFSFFVMDFIFYFQFLCENRKDGTRVVQLIGWSAQLRFSWLCVRANKGFFFPIIFSEFVDINKSIKSASHSDQIWPIRAYFYSASVEFIDVIFRRIGNKWLMFLYEILEDKDQAIQ